MSTRSGKRIRNSFESERITTNPEVITTNERKTRRKRLLEDEEINSIVQTVKRRSNYVSYPSEDELISDSTVTNGTETDPRRKLRKNTLKEHSINVQNRTATPIEKVYLNTKRTKKYIENTESPKEHQDLIITETVNKKKNNKPKQNKLNKEYVEITEYKENGESDNSAKKSKNNKKKRAHSNSMSGSNVQNSSLNKGNALIDSLHSATDVELRNSPTSHPHGSNNTTEHFENVITTNNKSYDKTLKAKKKGKRNKNKVLVNQIKTPTKPANCEDLTDKLNITVQINGDNHSAGTSLERNTSFDKSVTQNLLTIPQSLDVTFEKDSSDEMKFDKTPKLNSTFEIDNSTVRKLINSHVTSPGFDINDIGKQNVSKELKIPQCSMQQNSLLNPSEKSISVENSSKDDNSLDNDVSPTKDHCKTYKTSDILHYKSNEQIVLEESTLNGSNATDGATEVRTASNCGTTSSESNNGNIFNITPVLIDSSVEQSSINADNSQTPVHIQVSMPTPLKRQGTFTKDEPEVISKSLSISANNETPPNKLTLHTAGCTPYQPTSRNSQKEKRMLNLTHSIEKSDSSLPVTETTSRATKVMFCSPVNDAAVIKEQKKKVIKSSLKGSNKSFVFDDNRSSGRKRSLSSGVTSSGAAPSPGSARRPRTASAAGKVSDRSTPAARAPTPVGAGGRTKLPNFAALHQKQFAKMESLEECQARRAQRARRLLAPSGGLAVLDRTPLQGTTAGTPATAKNEDMESENRAKVKPAPVTKPGFTRFGFKLNLDFNPFSVTSKTQNKPIEQDNKVDTTVTALPSLAGATCAKQTSTKKESFLKMKRTAMLQKSSALLAERRNMDRNENRTIIKGVRTNRRFELQMKYRNING